MLVLVTIRRTLKRHQKGPAMERQRVRMDYVPIENVFFKKVAGYAWSVKLNGLKRTGTYTEPRQFC
jgi:hypothetical protein